MTIARNLALIVSISIAALALGPAAEAQAERRQPLSSGQIRQVMSQHTPAVRGCYVQHSTQRQGSMGSLTLEILVRASGQVVGVEVEAPASNEKKLSQCVSELAKSWRFPKSSSQTLVKYPMMFLHTQAQGAGPAVPGRATDQASVKKQAARPGGRSQM
ncbi:MAG TPA: AgmX/PglI C-terminal domain-containing protein [Haliangium sp.]|nr:AgmX/PglI C-terminal domain-containing protein [Haliangium sp.]